MVVTVVLRAPAAEPITSQLHNCAISSGVGMEASALLQRQLSSLEASTPCRAGTHWQPLRSCLPVPRVGGSRSSRRQRAAGSAPSPSPPPRPPQQQQKPPPAVIKTQALQLPPSEFAKIRKSVYVGSAVDLRGCPPQTRPEFAVIGRSNVGKSSLINMLTQNSKLAKVSKSPGMTKTINHFLINDSWYLVDLPGYGYAKTTSKDARASWLGFTKDYFLKRSVLVAVLLLVDASIPPQTSDLECAAWLAEAQVPLCVVFTKCDARKKAGPTPAANIKAWQAEFLRVYEVLPPCFETSSALGQGRGAVLSHLASLRVLDEREGGEL